MTTMVQYDCDIAVLGMGMAGSMAATAAGRLGMRVMAVDEAGFAGGSMTGMGTGPMMTFHAGENQVIRGLAQEMVERMTEAGWSPGHTVDSTGYTYTVTPFSAEGMKTVLERMMLESGVQLIYHTTVVGVEKAGDRLTRVMLNACGQRFAIAAKVFIDATGDGDVLALANVPFDCGRREDGRDQPMTMNFRIGGVDTARIRELMAQRPELFPFLKSKPGLEKHAVRLSVSGFQELMRQGIQSGELTVDRDIVLSFETDKPGEMIVNMSRINGESPVEPLSLTRAEIEGRRQVWELLGYLRGHIPGFEQAQLLYSGPSVGIRSSRRMRGSYTLTAGDILSNRMFEDGIAVFGYPIDIHSADGAETNSTFLEPGTYYSIPYRCLTNPTLTNLMAAGRNISCTFEAQASTRLSPCCAALGQAAGCAAALAVEEGVPPTQVDAARLRECLLKQGAYLGE